MKTNMILVSSILLPILLSGCVSFQYGSSLRESYDGLTKSEIKSALRSDALALVDAVSDIPAGWPSEMREIKDVVTCDGDSLRTLNWLISTDGMEWQHFYAYAIDVYLKELKHEPAMIYERRRVDNGFVVVPVMKLFFDESGRATKCSKKSCDYGRRRIEESE